MTRLDKGGPSIRSGNSGVPPSWIVLREFLNVERSGLPVPRQIGTDAPEIVKVSVMQQIQSANDLP